jgi:hypothetical protein
MPKRKAEPHPVAVAARVAARERQDAKNRLQAEELARRKLEKKVASLTAQKMCEDCGEKRPNWGLMEEKKKRWCGPCAKSHEGAVYIENAPALLPCWLPRNALTT